MQTVPNAPIHPSTKDLPSIPMTSAGLTKREWFAGMALEGLLSDHSQMKAFEVAAREGARELIKQDKVPVGLPNDLEEITRANLDFLVANRSIELADMMILRLNETTTDAPVLPKDQENPNAENRLST